ncbi:UNVERIFIED_CONTAM: hypothetical protein K2H54_046414 [Gekko kuhli]
MKVNDCVSTWAEQVHVGLALLLAAAAQWWQSHGPVWGLQAEQGLLATGAPNLSGSSKEIEGKSLVATSVGETMATKAATQPMERDAIVSDTPERQPILEHVESSREVPPPNGF